MTSSPALLPSAPATAGDGRRRWIAAAACGLAGVAVFQFFGNANHGYIDTSSLFWWWIFQWINPASETQHGWLILGISGWLLWRNGREPGSGVPGLPSDQVARGLRSPVTAPLAAMAGALAVHAVGFAAQQARLSILALLLFAWGVVRLGGGVRWGRAALFPLGFLLFAMPISVLDSLGFWLRLWVIDASTVIAHGAGVGVVQSGTQLMGPDGGYNYDVAAACSGVRSLMALAALSLLIGYLNFRGPVRRTIVTLTCLPLVYVGNVARIVAIVFAAQVGGARWGDIAHEVMGYLIFVIVLGGVVAASALIQRWWPERCRAGSPNPAGSAEGAGRSSGRVPTQTRRGSETPPYIVAMIVVALAAVEAGFLQWLTQQPARGQVGVYLGTDGRNPVELPAFLGRDWVGWPAPVTAVEKEILPADTGYSRMNYVSSRGARPVFLSIVLSGQDRTSIHRPELCLVGQGLTIEGSFEHRFVYPTDQGGRAARGPQSADSQIPSFPATVLRVTRQSVGRPGSAGVPPAPAAGAGGPVPQLVVYWFVNGDRVVGTHWERVLVDAANRVLRGRADRWAYVLMQTEATDGEAAALERLQTVLNGTLPRFQKAESTQR